MILKTDCKHFPGDRPCIPNKTEGKKCDDCNYYEPVNFKMLIIKLDAIGDVLRTTSILHSLKAKHPAAHITWLTKSNAEQLFKNNKLVDRVLLYEEPGTVAKMETEEFDLLIHPDASPTSSAIAAKVNAKLKKGYISDKLGKVIPVNEDAIEWLEMGAFDEYKKKNKKSYQQIIHEIAGLKFQNGEIIINLTDEEKKFQKRFYEENNLSRFEYLIGLNTGASKRWQFKQWRFDGYLELIKKLTPNKNIGILIYGGPEEIERNQKLKNNFPNAIDTGSQNSLREFFALLGLSDIIVTGDTLALHAATALKKQTICLFGPTSNEEIEDYDRIIKIIPDMECLVCYKQRCDFVPNCMDLITVEMVLSAIEKASRKLNKKN